MVKKRIFISIHYLELGGAESALIGLLQSFDFSKYNVDLFLHSHRGELMPFIPKEVNLLPEIPAYASIERPIKDVLFDCLKLRTKSKENRDKGTVYRDRSTKLSEAKGFSDRLSMLRVVYGRIKAKYHYKQYLKKTRPKDESAIFGYVGKCVTPYLPSLKQFGEYDLAISFLNPHDIVLEKVRAKKKLAWIHTDYSRIDVNTKLEFPVWDGYDKIVSISPDVTKTFVQTFPSLTPKVIEIENIISPSFVRERANLISEEEVNKEITKENQTINILSVGRFCEAKNYDNVPDICRRINYQFKALNSQYKVRWYLIGYGGDEELICRKIEEAGMQDHVILLGKKSNPYPYIKACDIYIQPSRYEGKSITVREAQILCKPVVVTNYPTASSQIKDGIDGVIVPMDNDGCAKGIIDFILNTKLQENIVEYLKNYDYGNMDEVEKLYKIINE